MRASKEHHWKALKAATFRLVDMAGDGEFVGMTRVKAPALSKYKAQHETDSFIPVDVVFDAELVAGTPVMTETLARLHGFRLVPLDGGAEAPAVNLRDVLDAIDSDCARLKLCVRDSLADGHVDGAERREIARKIDQLKASIADLERGL